MQTLDVYGELTDIFREVFDDDTIVLTEATTAADIRDWDSANHVNLIVSIETRMNLRFKSLELESLHNVGHLVEVIDAKLNLRKPVGRMALAV